MPRQLVYCRFPLNDGGGNDPNLLLQTVQTVVDLLAAGTPTIVDCLAGMSRSPTIAAFALVAHLDKTPDDIISPVLSVKSLELKNALWKNVARVFGRVRN